HRDPAIAATRRRRTVDCRAATESHGGGTIAYGAARILFGALQSGAPIGPRKAAWPSGRKRGEPKRSLPGGPGRPRRVHQRDSGSARAGSVGGRLAAWLRSGEIAARASDGGRSQF